MGVAGPSCSHGFGLPFKLGPARCVNSRGNLRLYSSSVRKPISGNLYTDCGKCFVVFFYIARNVQPRPTSGGAGKFDQPF